MESSTDLKESKLLSLDDEKEGLTKNEKMKILEEDMESLYAFALARGFSSTQFQSLLTPVLGEKKSVGKRVVDGSRRSLLLLSVFVAILATAWYVPSVKTYVNVHMKLAAIKVVKYWDKNGQKWTALASTFSPPYCLVKNPYQNGSLGVEEEKKPMSQEDCAHCFDFTEIQRLNQTNQDVIADLLQADMPFVVQDAMRGWPRDNKSVLVFTAERLAQLFSKHQVLIDATVKANCTFVSSETTDEKNYTMTDFAVPLQTNNYAERFYATWENCDTNAAKVYRMLSKRPYFVPLMVQMDPLNRILIARGNFTKAGLKLTYYPAYEDASILIVVQGGVQVDVKPHDECIPHNCTGSTFYVGKGEAVVVPTRIWNATFSPMSDELTLGYMTGLGWDS